MRKISKKAIAAFVAKKNCKCGNTEVIVNGKSIELRLYGHLIAEIVGDKRPYIDSCGYHTNTTRERLNSIPGVSVSFRIGGPFLNGEKWDGKRKLVSSDYYMILGEI